MNQTQRILAQKGTSATSDQRALFLRFLDAQTEAGQASHGKQERAAGVQGGGPEPRPRRLAEAPGSPQGLGLSGRVRGDTLRTL